MSNFKIRNLVAELNKHRHAYYNLNAPVISDAAYDLLFDELKMLEAKTGIILSDSPTQTVGYKAVSKLEKTEHSIPLLSLDKTKHINELAKFIGGRFTLLMHKLDGLTLKLVYENGLLVEASTRGDGHVGEVVTHNICALIGVPIAIPYKNRLVITGEGYILSSDFDVLQETLLDSTGKPYKNARNLAAGSIRLLDAATCSERRVRFTPFNVLEGFEEDPVVVNSKFGKLSRLTELGFSKCESIFVKAPTAQVLEDAILTLQRYAEQYGIPIDGIVATFDEIDYSLSCGNTDHHYKDGLAFKFIDNFHETILRNVEWNTSRFGDVAPVAIFDPVEIDGTEITRASLHNLSFIESLKLNIGCRIQISKRNMIIPHVEANLDRNNGLLTPPSVCPSCGMKTSIQVSGAKGSETKTLVCKFPQCMAKAIKRLVHFVEKKAMNIEGLSEATIEKFYNEGFLRTYHDFYTLHQYKDEIIAMEGLGEKSFNKIIQSIETSRSTTFSNFLIAMDIPLVGQNASKIFKQTFADDLKAFREAVDKGMDFTAIPDIGSIINANIHEWFADIDNRKTWDDIFALMIFKQHTSTVNQNTPDNPFNGCIVVVTGTLVHFTRSTINAKLESLGAKAGDSVSKKTDYLIYGDKAGSKLQKAQDLGIKILTEAEFLKIVGN